MRRRTFVVAGLAASTGACGRRKSPWRFFTIEEARTLEAICGRIVPEDRDPGAVEAGVVGYIDIQLTCFYKPLQKTYRQGIAAIDRLGGGKFADLSAADQTSVLKKAAVDPRIKPFFDLLVDHTMQGFYGDPRHGGNRDRVSWKMLRLPYPPLRGRR